MKVNLHTHTYRCGHAHGTEREYIERAIENGIEVMGFSDHSPFVFPNGYESPHRVPMSEATAYVEDIRALREEYKGKIDIKIGYEMEYYPTYFKDMLKVALESGAEYLILGEHYLRNELPEMISAMSSRHKNDEKDLTDYVDAVCEGMSTGVFTYVAHPDMVLYDDNEFYLSQMERICKASLEYDVPLEINFQGSRLRRIYPRDSFWQMVGKMGCKTVLGFDAHEVPDAYDGESLVNAERLVREYGLNLVEYPEIRDIRNLKIEA